VPDVPPGRPGAHLRHPARWHQANPHPAHILPGSGPRPTRAPALGLGRETGLLDPSVALGVAHHLPAFPRVEQEVHSHRALRVPRPRASCPRARRAGRPSGSGATAAPRGLSGSRCLKIARFKSSTRPRASGSAMPRSATICAYQRSTNLPDLRGREASEGRLRKAPQPPVLALIGVDVAGHHHAAWPPCYVGLA